MPQQHVTPYKGSLSAAIQTGDLSSIIQASVNNGSFHWEKIIREEAFDTTTTEYKFVAGFKATNEGDSALGGYTASRATYLKEQHDITAERNNILSADSQRLQADIEARGLTNRFGDLITGDSVDPSKTPQAKLKMLEETPDDYIHVFHPALEKKGLDSESNLQKAKNKVRTALETYNNKKLGGIMGSDTIDKTMEYLDTRTDAKINLQTQKDELNKERQKVDDKLKDVEKVSFHPADHDSIFMPNQIPGITGGKVASV